MNRPGARWWCAAIVFAAFAPNDALAQASMDSVTLRPTSVTVDISNDRYYSGQYQAQGISRVCGTMTLGFPHRANSFTVEFPDDEPDLRVRSIQFNADTLPVGATTRSFYIAVGIRVGERGTPPQYVVRANEPRFNEPGTAQLQKEPDGGTRLTVDGTAALGVKVRATVICRPRR